jgi:excisionase family DNA binding protein
MSGRRTTVSDEQEWLSTGQAAKCCSVAPDTILKWVKKGKLRARQTAGGHYRIHRDDLRPLILSRREGPAPGAPGMAGGAPLRCWEYFGRGGQASEECRECIVYRSRTSWCFHMVERARGLGHSGTFCLESCGECPYYQRVTGSATRVLVVTRDRSFRACLEEGGDERIRLRFAEDGYEASAVIHDMRPAFVVLDHDLLKDGETALLDRLASDARLPGVRVVLAARKGRLRRAKAEVANQIVVRILEKPFGLGRIAAVIDAFPVEVRPLEREENV